MRTDCHRVLRYVLLALVCAGAPAHAQLGVPNAPGVNLPGLDVPGTLGTVTQGVRSAANDTLATADAALQTGLRATRVRELLRDNRNTLEADPNGAPMLRGQLVGLAPSDAALARIIAAGFAVTEDRVLEGLGMRYLIFTAPTGMSTRRALRRLRALDPDGSYDYNHVYTESGEISQSAAGTASAPDSTGSSGQRLGLIDGGIADSHPVFQGTALHRWGCEGAAIPSAHGTAVASLMAGLGGDFHSAAPGATLYAADVYCGRPTGGALRDLANAFAWMAQEQVPVINVSLVGPPNILLEQLVRNMIARGHLIVAAVGNDGPAARPLYPAAYPGVIGVTAVDARNRVLVEAARGKQVAFAAPGADIAAADIAAGYAAVRGTSFAAPIVAGLLSSYMRSPDRGSADAALDKLAAVAADLGSRGVDKTYGRGFVGQAVRESLAPVLARVAKTPARN